MWKDFSIWSSKIFQEKRFRARVHYNDFDTVLCSVIADVEDPKDPLLSFAGWN